MLGPADSPAVRTFDDSSGQPAPPMSTRRPRFHGHERSAHAALIAAVAFWTFLGIPGPAMGQATPPTGAPIAPSVRPGSGSQEPGRRVLLLYTEPRLTPSIVSVDQALRSTLQARSPVPVYFTEFLISTCSTEQYPSAVRELPAGVRSARSI
jgi:hypothetical protein